MQTQNDDKKVQRIIRWRETMATLNDERFFEIMRVYIGEIQTPYNKDNLIEQISSILRKEQNKKRIISYLSEFDIKILSVIFSVKEPTKDKITDFFKNEYPLSEIYSALLNLTERLIIYSYKNEVESQIIAVNPLLEDTLQPLANINYILPALDFIQHNFNPKFTLTPQFIAAFISYIYENPEMCKNNSQFKKKDIERLESIFPGKANILEKLLAAFINLKLVRSSEKGLLVDEKRFQFFSKNTELQQYAFFAAAAATRLGREGLRSQTQLLIDIAASIPKEGLSRSSLSRLAFLISNKTEDNNASPAKSRFSRILESHNSSSERIEFSGQLIDLIIDNAILFGILEEAGKSENDELILTPGALLVNKPYILSSEQKKGIVNINAGTNIAILPGLSLSELLPFVQFLNITNCSTITEYEITRKSISRAFDKNISKETVLDLLLKYNSYSIPQSLEMNIDEWQNSYSSAILYKGFVLKVNEKSERVIEKNPNIQPFIQLKLAPGVFLLNIPIEQDESEFIKLSGIEFMGNVKTPISSGETINYPLIKNGTNYFNNDAIKNNNVILTSEEISNAEDFKNALYEKLKTLELTKQQFEGLATRIKRNVILTEEQLKPETVRMEILEADGMNYAGKIHLLENAINDGDMIEIEIPDEKNSSVINKILGQPLMLMKQQNDSLVKISISNEEETSSIRFYSVSRANHIKIIRTSIFKS